MYLVTDAANLIYICTIVSELRRFSLMTEKNCAFFLNLLHFKIIYLIKSRANAIYGRCIPEKILVQSIMIFASVKSP